MRLNEDIKKLYFFNLIDLLSNYFKLSVQKFETSNKYNEIDYIAHYLFLSIKFFKKILTFLICTVQPL